MAKLICASCKKEIQGRYVQAVGKNWHPDCFRCAGCGRPITTGEFLHKYGKPYHADCYQQKFAPRCAGCGELIDGHSIRALRKHWHPEHFVCAHCGRPIEGSFFIHQGKPYCKEDYKALFAEKCARCGAVISGRYFVDFHGNKLCAKHRREPRCTSCGEFIDPGDARSGLKYPDGRWICGSCHKRAYHDPAAVNRLADEVQKVLARHGIKIDNLKKIPLRLVGQKELRSSVHTRSRGKDISGLTSTKVSTLFGLEHKREVVGVQVLYGLPYEQTGAVLAHELGHVWLFTTQFPKLPRHVEEGICDWFSALWLQSVNTPAADTRLQMIEKNPSQVYGRGYRAVKKAVQKSSLDEVLAYVKRHAALPPK